MKGKLLIIIFISYSVHTTKGIYCTLDTGHIQVTQVIIGCLVLLGLMFIYIRSNWLVHNSNVLFEKLNFINHEKITKNINFLFIIN